MIDFARVFGEEKETRKNGTGQIIDLCRFVAEGRFELSTPRV
jgi:hypothetical protein